MRTLLMMGLAALPLALFSTAADADETTPSARRRMVIVVDQFDVHGRVPPARTFDITPVVPRLPLPELKKPFLQRIAAAVETGPF